MPESSMFWTDATQAAERLTGSHILYGDAPVYVMEVTGRGEPQATIRTWPEGGLTQVKLADPKFHKFRKLPPLGWVNYSKNKMAVLLERRPIRGRTHGLADNNTLVGSFDTENEILVYRNYSYSHIAKDPAYVEICKTGYPRLKDVLQHVREGTSIAFSPMYAIYRDQLGLRWLYRSKDKIGIFSDVENFLLPTKFRHFREELRDSSVFTINNIKDF
jgi:hypothetical protein